MAGLSSTALSSTAMVLAAGFGTRMRPLTLTKPKPLQSVGGKTMLDHALDRLVEAGIARAVINTHYLADQIAAHVKTRHDIDILISYEPEILDTGGGIVRALPHFDGKPFFALNADLPWTDSDAPALARLREAWNPEIMDALLLMMPTRKARGFLDKGDFNLGPEGHLARHGVLPPRSHVWIGVQILKPELYENPAAPVFSNNLVWDSLEARARLYGLEHHGSCYHVGTPEDLEKANALCESGEGWG